jgi:hypothetical protein
MNDIMLSDKNDIQFNQRGSIASAVDLFGDANAVSETVRQWIRNRVLLDYLNGHPEMESLDLLVGEINSNPNTVAVTTAVGKYIEEAIMANELIESCHTEVTRDDKELALFVNINYVVSGSATIENMQAMWRL